MVVRVVIIGIVLVAFSPKEGLAQSDTSRFLISDVRIHTGLKKIIENGAVGIDHGKIVYVGPEASAPSGFDQIISKQGMELYPGFIVGHTTLGLNEIDAVRATQDYSETGDFNPECPSYFSV